MLDALSKSPHRGRLRVYSHACSCVGRIDGKQSLSRILWSVDLSDTWKKCGGAVDGRASLGSHHRRHCFLVVPRLLLFSSFPLFLSSSLSLFLSAPSTRRQLAVNSPSTHRQLAINSRGGNQSICARAVDGGASLRSHYLLHCVLLSPHLSSSHPLFPSSSLPLFLSSSLPLFLSSSLPLFLSFLFLSSSLGLRKQTHVA